MTNSQKLQMKMSETRQAVNALAGAESPDDISKRDALTAELAAHEVEFRAALESEDKATSTGTPEAREWSDLHERFDLGEMFGNVIEHRASSGPIAEVQTERGLGGNDIPVEMLMEHRAVTPAPSEVGQTQTQIEGYVFPQSVAAFMGILSPVLPPSDAAFPVLTSDPAAGTPAENATQAETTGAFSPNAVTPSRIQASFFWSREDQGRMVGMADALSEALQGAMGDKLDQQIIAGPNGLLGGTNLPDHNRGSASDYAHYVAELLYGRVDGKFAADLSDIRVVMGSQTFGNAATKLPTNGEVNALARIRNDSAGVRVSAHVPFTTPKQEAIVRLGLRGDMVAPIWGGISLIPDEVTKAGTGQIVLTAVMLHAVKIKRAGGFYKQETNHS